jgi:Trk K+ transport system NAD-binding subunit
MNALGITSTVNPEFNSAVMFAEKLSMHGVKDIFPLSMEIKIAEVRLPSSLVGRQIDVRKINEKNDFEVIALKRYSGQSSSGNGDTCKVISARQLNDKFVFESTDTLIVMGNKDDILDFMKEK